MPLGDVDGLGVKLFEDLFDGSALRATAFGRTVAPRSWTDWAREMRQSVPDGVEVLDLQPATVDNNDNAAVLRNCWAALEVAVEAECRSILAEALRRRFGTNAAYRAGIVGPWRRSWCRLHALLVNRFGLRALLSPTLTEFLLQIPALVTSDEPLSGGAGHGLPFGRELLRIAGDLPQEDRPQDEIFLGGPLAPMPQSSVPPKPLPSPAGGIIWDEDVGRWVELQLSSVFSLLEGESIRMSRPSVFDRAKAEIAERVAAEPGSADMLPDWALPSTAVALDELDSFARLNHWVGIAAQSDSSLKISLPRDLKAFVNEQTAAGHYSTSSDYICDLVLSNRKRQAQEPLDQLLLEVLGTTAEQVLPDDLAELRREVSELIAVKRAKQPPDPLRTEHPPSFSQNAAG